MSGLISNLEYSFRISLAIYSNVALKLSTKSLSTCVLYISKCSFKNIWWAITIVSGGQLKGVSYILGWNRSGWLHIFFNPINTFIIPVDYLFLNFLFSCQIISSYKYFCLLLIPHLTIDYVFLGNCVSTSFFNLLKKKGLKTVCNFLRISWLIGKFFYRAYWKGKLNH